MMVSALAKVVTTRRIGKAWIFWVVLNIPAFHIFSDFARATPPVTSSGLNTQIKASTDAPAGAVQHDILGGTRAGTNLFHSFGEFGVPNNHIANFLNDTGLVTENILGRVTGGNVSNILGMVQTSGFGNANLFLMNPAGIVFGPNASLNVKGSVAFMTADYLRMDNSSGPNAAVFHADPSRASLLTSAPVTAFGFVGAAPGNITVEGSQLRVPAGHEISLVGGNIMIKNGTLDSRTIQPARLTAPDGQINLAATKSGGEFLADLPFEPTELGVPNVNGASFTSYGSAHFASGSTVDVSQTGNGRVSIRGGHLILEIQNAVLDTAHSDVAVGAGQDTLVLAPKSWIMSQTLSGEHGPDIRMEADKISIVGVPGASTKENFTEKPLTGISSNTQGTGDAGNIVLKATEDIKIMRVVNLESVAFATGRAGNIQLSSMHGNIRMTEGGKEAQVYSWTYNKGDTGNVTVSALEGDIVVNGASLYTLSFGSGRAEQVNITARNLSMKAGLLNNFTGRVGETKPGGITVTLSGNLTMTADSSLVLPDRTIPDSLIVTSSLGPAPSGDINIKAKDIVATHGSIINSATFASGPGGHLKIVAETLQLTDGAQLSSGSTRAFNRGSIPQNIDVSGQGGDVTIQAEGARGSILIDGKGSGIFADTEGTGIGGNISLTAGKSISLNNGGAISASSTGNNSGDAGSITVNAGQQLDLTNGSSITTTTQSRQANGGDIDIRAVDRVRLVNDSKISTDVDGTEGSGGNIFIDPNVVILEGSDVTARAIGGAGGNITFVTPLFLADSASVISASSQRGVSGTVLIQSPTSNLSGTVGQLASKTNPPQVLLQNRCVALAGGEQSTFILAGRDALPSEPGGWLSSPVAIGHWTGEGTEDHASGLLVQRKNPDKLPIMAELQDKSTILSLRRLTPPGFLIRTFATGTTGCPA